LGDTGVPPVPAPKPFGDGAAGIRSFRTAFANSVLPECLAETWKPRGGRPLRPATAKFSLIQPFSAFSSFIWIEKERVQPRFVSSQFKVIQAKK
jgi:hypothetical protein